MESCSYGIIDFGRTNAYTVFDLIGARGAYLNFFSIINENKETSQEKDRQVGDNK